jgi:predicted RNase H-like HicB family nuclease
MAEKTAYVYVIEQANYGSYWAYLPDLPGCTTTAQTAEEIESKLQEAVELYLSYYRDRGQSPPRAGKSRQLDCCLMDRRPRQS